MLCLVLASSDAYNIEHDTITLSGNVYIGYTQAKSSQNINFLSADAAFKFNHLM